MKIDDAAFEVNMANYSKDITKTRQLMVPPDKQILMHNRYMEEIFHILFKEKHVIIKKYVINR